MPRFAEDYEWLADRADAILLSGMAQGMRRQEVKGVRTFEPHRES